MIMKCPKCLHENEDGALFCNNCGFALAEKKKDWTSILLLAWCVSMIFFFAIGLINTLLINPYIYSTYATEYALRTTTIIGFVISTISSLTSFVIPIAIPKKSFKILAFIIVLLVFIGGLIVHIINLSFILNR